MRASYSLPFVLALVMLAISCGRKEEDQSMAAAPFFGTLEEAKSAAASDGRSILVEFYADW